MSPRPRTRSPEPVDCDCTKSRHVHATAVMYQEHRCGCTPCGDAFREYRAKRLGYNDPVQAAPVTGEFVATFPMHGGISEARAKRQAYDQLLALTREQGVTVLKPWTFRVERTRAGLFLTARAPAESDRPVTEVRAAAEHFAYEHEQAHPALAQWITKHLEVAA